MMVKYGLAKASKDDYNQVLNYGDDEYYNAVLHNPQADYQAPLSDAHHYRVSVKRDNFIQLFTKTQNVDAFVATHLYGAMSNLGEDLNPVDLDEFLNTS